MRRYRLTAGLTQEALAERARMSPNGIGALERGYRRNPQRETIALLAGALALDHRQRQEFEAAASRPAARITVGPWADLAAASLPLSLTSFIGRETVLGEIAALVRERRLVTLTGTSGVGKTQTALRVASALNVDLDGAVCFVGLAPIRDPSLVIATIAAAVGAQQVPNRPLLETISVYLRHRSMLLIVDNCEHLIEQAANVALALLSSCSRVRILATSREPLKAAGEYIYRLPSLDDLSAITLFSDRARAVDQHFTTTTELTPIIAEICRRLDGIPLAIELAAARANVLPPELLAGRLDDRFRLLTGGERTSLPRQQTMRSTIAWSYDLLAPAEQTLFNRLGIFAGSFDVAAAEDICSGDGVEQRDVWELLTSLTEKSLMTASTTGEQERYLLYESTRAYALEKLENEAVRLAARHASDFAQRADAAYESFGKVSTSAWLATVLHDLDNYRAAMEWGLSHRDGGPVAATIAASLRPVWDRCLSVEGHAWCRAALERVNEATLPRIAARLHVTFGRLLSGKTRYDEGQRALALSEAACDRGEAVHSRILLAYQLSKMGNWEEAEREIHRALTGARACGDAALEADALDAFAVIKGWRRGDTSVRELFAQVLSTRRALGDEVGAAKALKGLAEVEFALGDAESAVRFSDEALEIFAEAQRVARMPSDHELLNNAAAYRIALKKLPDARSALRDALQCARDTQFTTLIVISCEFVALIEALEGDAQVAARLLGFSDAHYGAQGEERLHTERVSHERLTALLRERLTVDAIAAFATEGAAWPVERALGEARRVIG